MHTIPYKTQLGNFYECNKLIKLWLFQFYTDSVVVGIFEHRARNSQYWKYLFLEDTEHIIF